MEKQKRWQLYLILAVIALTIYNILPTLFYYSNPLKSPISQARSEAVAKQVVDRVNALGTDSVEWLYSFSKLIGVKPESIALKDNDPSVIAVKFKNSADNEKFKKLLNPAGELIPFVPAQLELQSGMDTADSNTSYVARKIGVELNSQKTQSLFQYATKYDQNKGISQPYKEIVFDRVGELAKTIGGISPQARYLKALTSAEANQLDEAVFGLAHIISETEKALGANSAIAKRVFASLTTGLDSSAENAIQLLTKRIEGLKTKLSSTSLQYQTQQKKLEAEGKPVDSKIDEELASIKLQSETLENALTLLKNQPKLFKNEQKALSAESIQKDLASGFAQVSGKNLQQTLNLNKTNPFIESLLIDWGSDKVHLKFYDDIQKIRQGTEVNEDKAYARDKLSQMVINEIARISQQTDEKIAPTSDTFALSLTELPDAQSFLSLDLGQLAKMSTEQLQHLIEKQWVPTQADFSRENFPVTEWSAFQKLPLQKNKLGLVVYAPSMSQDKAPEGFKNSSIYVIGRGMNSLIKKNSDIPNKESQQAMNADLQNLSVLLQQKGFIAYPGSSFGFDSKFKDDIIFEQSDFYNNILAATREKFGVHGTRRSAILDFSDVEQRLLTENQIDDKIQEDLVKWQDEYHTGQISIDPADRLKVPAPTKNPYLENFKLSFKKYFRGDDRKVLKWGLDLSGGKTVRIGLRDANNRKVTAPEDLNQAVNELYKRINSLGVSERTIRIENDNIILEFPGSQGLSASDLIKASAMSFHIVNEKFAADKGSLSAVVNEFLRNVWNEAVVTNRKDVKSINEIALEHLGSDVQGQEAKPRSDAAKLLYEKGLRIARPGVDPISSQFNDTLSSIAIYREDAKGNLYEQAHPLLIVFSNFALEGASLTDVHVGYDATQGNTLSFSVKNSYTNNAGSPRDDFYTWTSQFSKDQIAGTPKASFSGGSGWPMAVILNDQVISTPTLNAALRDGGQITGRFTQREINQLAADLKAGSLSFTPYILSEENVSAELGKEERAKGITASLLALTLVVVAMVAYYRFAGLVASCAVLFNLLIMWGILQNIGAALTLPGIAGIVLTIGMAVDANVLVFERIREEFRASGRIGSAIQAGYRKAFSAIVDSNITTIIAALILIQFDSGPIKGFAVTLIIGIISSMFTALFMTRYFFAGWVQNPKNKELNMSEFIHDTKFDFLGKTKAALVASLAVMVLGSMLFYSQRNAIFGMDFTGGYSLTTELVEQADTDNYRLRASETLLASGASSNDFEVRELSRPNQLRIRLGMNMEEPGNPFYGMPQALSEGPFNHNYQRNPRLDWVVNSLAKGGLSIQQSELDHLDSNWTAMSGQFSEAMRNAAIIGLGLAMLSILAYITMRFEFKYALAAIIALAHDVIISIGILALFNKLGFPVQVDLQVIGAIMTIIGYSLNDTIIVFDRIREDLKIYRKLSFKEIINHSLNVTLSRTLMTSGTTLLVLLALVLFGGPSIFAFSLVMTIGVFVGTFSSLFIAPPILLYLHNREALQNQTGLKRA